MSKSKFNRLTTNSSLAANISTILASILTILSYFNLSNVDWNIIIKILIVIVIISLVILFIIVIAYFINSQKTKIIEFLRQKIYSLLFAFLSFLGVIILIYFNFYHPFPPNDNFVMIKKDNLSFFILNREVTTSEYIEFLKANDYNEEYLPVWMKNILKYRKQIKNYYDGFTDSEQPIVGITQAQANAYCNWLSNRRRNNYKLPNELQWEVAALAGGTGNFGLGFDRDEITESNLESFAWYKKNIYQKPNPERTRTVGLKHSNAFGLYDMWGNAAEWVEERVKISNSENIVEGAVIKGGSWEDSSEYCFTLYRDVKQLDYASRTISFRVICEP